MRQPFAFRQPLAEGRLKPSLPLGYGHATRTRLRAETLRFGVQARARYFLTDKINVDGGFDHGHEAGYGVHNDRHINRLGFKSGKSE
jgi:hypothetical protein